MFNKTKITISVGAFALTLLGACSDDNSTAGATVDPDVLAEKINFSLNPSSTIALKNGSITVYDEENGASGLCATEGMSYASKIQVREGENLDVVTSLEYKGESDVCENLYKEFKNECESRKGDFEERDKDCKKGGFSIWCQYDGDESDSTKSVLDEFIAKMSDDCNKLTEGAESLYGEYTTPSSTSKDDGDVVPASNSSTDPVDIPPEDIDKYTQYPSDSSDKKDDDGEVDVPSTGILVPTLDNYTAQFTDDPAELSFDSHVLAYKGRASCSVINEGKSIIETTSEMDSRLYAIAADEIEECFPETAEAAKAIEYKFKENCNYFVVTSSDGMQPTGHSITKVAKDAIEFTSVSTGGMCMLSQAFFDVIFLIEDCDNLISESTKTTNKTFTSETWACEEGSYSPAKSASAYGEWFRADLIFP